MSGVDSAAGERDPLPFEDDAVQTRYITCKQITRWTFQTPNVRDWVGYHLRDADRVLNAPCGLVRLDDVVDADLVRVDSEEAIELERSRTLNGETYEEGDVVPTGADVVSDVIDVAEYFSAESFDAVVFDPPYSLYQTNLRYDGRQVGHAKLAKEAFDALLRPGGKVVEISYSASGMPGRLGYEREERAIFNTFGRGKDAFGSVDRKTQRKLGAWSP